MILLVCLVVWWLWMPAVVLVLWLVFHFVFGGYGQLNQGYAHLLQAEFLPHDSLAHATALFWVWVLIGMVGTALIAVTPAGEDLSGGVRRTVIVTALVATALSAVWTWNGVWDNDKNQARYYLQDTVFHTPSVNPAPASLRPLTDSARPAHPGSRCALVGTADVASCVQTDQLPGFDWDPRSASREAATTVISNSGALASNVKVMDQSEHYLPDTTPGSGVWTAILDGTGTRPLEGVAVWDGQSNSVRVCQYQGSDSINRAFEGTGADSLGNLLAERFPALVYTRQDISGYCDGTGDAARPVIVIPVERQIGWKNRTVLEPSGVIVVTGSANGKPTTTYHATVTPGEFPGQVYPWSVAQAQLAAADWAAGRGNRDNAGFGYSQTTVGSNAANSGQYVMRSLADGHVYFVTPLTPRGSQSQVIVGYAVERADQVGTGLNQLDIRILPDRDDQTSMSQLQSRMTTYLDQIAPQLLNSGTGGRLQEIIPYGNGMWRGFVDLDGITQAYVNISADTTVTPSLVSLPGLAITGAGTIPNTGPSTGSSSGPGSGTTPSAGSTTAPPPANSADCSGNPATMSTTQLAQCIQKFADALAGRTPAATSPPPAPKSTG